MNDKRRPLDKSAAGYKAMAKVVRRYTDFSIDLRKPLSRSDKAKISRYFGAIQELQSRPHHIYRTKNKKKLKVAQQYSHEHSLPHLKVAFVPVADEEVPPRIRFNKTGLVVHELYVSTQFIPFDQKKLARGGARYVKREIKRDPKATAFSLVCGDHNMVEQYSREDFPAFVAEKMEIYSNPDDNHYWKNWLRGAQSHEFNNQADQDEYVLTKRRSRDKKQRETKARRAREKRKKEKSFRDRLMKAHNDAAVRKILLEKYNEKELEQLSKMLISTAKETAAHVEQKPKSKARRKKAPSQ